jgi:hypothetical protein
MHTMNRRALVAGAAVLPAIAIPAAAQCVLGGDTELLALRPQLIRAHEEAEAASAVFDTAYKPMLDKAWEMTLATGADPNSSALYHEIALQLHRADPKYDALDKDQLAAWGRYDVIAAKIVAQPCQTLAGLLVKAMLVQYSWPKAFLPAVKDVDGIDECHLRHLVDELVKMAGA